MNLLSDRLLSTSSTERLSLPGVLAAMARGEVRNFPGLRPHQRAAWHMFLVQVGTLALWKADSSQLPEEEGAWAEALRGLTPEHDDDAPWRLVVTDWTRPAFLQPPAPQGLKWSVIKTPDALDLLITARNHDLKQQVAVEAQPEHWIYALVSLQTSEGYGGAGNHGIARMNGGSSSRPMLGLAPASAGSMVPDPSRWWARDVRILLAARQGGTDGGLAAHDGHALLWCLEWEEGHPLDLRALDPLFIEVCRRVRLTEHSDRCGEARNKDPVSGVIGFQKGPLWRRGSQCSRGHREPRWGCWLWKRSPRSAARISFRRSRSSRSAVS